MKPLFWHLLIIFYLPLLIACNEEIPMKEEFEPQVFIFGSITNTTDFVTLSIQKTVQVNGSSPNPVNDAEVSLFSKDQNGETILITNSFEVSNGSYKSVEMITPVIGNEYWIEVQTSDGDIYKSNPELLRNPTPITTVTIDSNNRARINFSDPGDVQNFYLMNTSFFFDQIIITSDAKAISDILFNGNANAFIDSNVSFSGTFNSIEGTLFNVNYTSFQYYVNVIAQEDLMNSSNISGDPSQLFAKPPINLIGNIMNTTTDKSALGNFAVMGTSTSISTL